VLISKGIKDTTSMVMEAKKIFTKINLLQIAWNKCISVKRDINLFTNRFEKMVKIGSPSTWSDKGKFLSFEEYIKSLFIARESESKFQGMAEKLRGQVIVDLLMDDFHLLWQKKKCSQILLHMRSASSWISHACT
jgi:hypothetical protein